MLAVNIYITHSFKATGANIEKMVAIKRMIDILGIPFILLGDWNVTPQELVASGWISCIRGTRCLAQVAKESSMIMCSSVSRLCTVWSRSRLISKDYGDLIGLHGVAQR